jgi:DNA (cytosine-5)-methyltransferase 1
MAIISYLSVCSGIEAASLAVEWAGLDWRPVGFAEIDPACCAVLRERYPDVRNYGDFTGIGVGIGIVAGIGIGTGIGGEAGAPAPECDLLVGGTPCQAFSVAGLRGGLDDERGNLTLEFIKLAGRLRPRWLVWENVPGVFSSITHNAPDPCPPEVNLDGDDGPEDGAEIVVEDEYDAEEVHAFSCFLAGLSEFGYGFAYRVLDARHFGVPQRRRRVFVVGYLGDWRRAAAVLFERESLSGHPPPGREAREDVAGCLGGGAGARGWCNDTDRMTFVPEVAYGLNAHPSRRYDAQSNETFVAGTLNSNGKAAGSATQQDAESNLLVPIAFSCKDTGADAIAGVAPVLRAMGHKGSHSNAGGQIAVAFTERGREKGRTFECQEDIAYCLTNPGSGGRTHSRQVMTPRMAVRRLTPRECERLQGMPDDWTLVAYRGGKPMADGPRYKMIGNSMAVPVVAWIFGRIELVERLREEKKESDMAARKAGTALNRIAADAAKAARKPALERLREITAPEDAIRMEALAVRLIQIQDEMKGLEREKGYTDSGTGNRVAGATDELMELLDGYDLDGLRIEDYLVYRSSGESARIDKMALLNLGVDPLLIEQATKKTPWTAIVCRRSGEREY